MPSHLAFSPLANSFTTIESAEAELKRLQDNLGLTTGADAIKVQNQLISAFQDRLNTLEGQLGSGTGGGAGSIDVPVIIGISPEGVGTVLTQTDIIQSQKPAGINPLLIGAGALALLLFL